RRLTNHFTGQLGATIAKELYLKGADITLIHGESSYTPPDYLPYQIAKTYQDYLELVIKKLSNKNYIFGIFSAAVADYQPQKIMLGKIPSKEKLKSIKLIPTIKVIEEVRKKFPELYMVTFKYQEQVSHETLIELASARIKKGYQVVIANRGEEMGGQQGHIAYLVTKNELPQKMIGKKRIATKIVEHLENVCKLT
ncbi:MAG: phosphopantothenoylcysteine decarboxylase, partial [cyanobacterium endosymbiont of Rhopalodia fuxianensis]